MEATSGFAPSTELGAGTLPGDDVGTACPPSGAGGGDSPLAGGEAVGARVKKILPLEQNYSVSEKNFLKQILRFRLGFRKRFLPC